MRQFMTECKDTRTGLSMVLSGASYNMACDWLERILQNYGLEIKRIEYRPLDDMTAIITDGRTYFYDETRGYLLGN